MKTMKQWNESKKDFREFVQAGEEIDSEIYDYFLGVVPPKKQKTDLKKRNWFLNGEIVRHSKYGPLYLCFVQDKNIYRYIGIHPKINAN